MSVETKLDRLHFWARQNRLLGYFAVFNPVVLALAFLPSGFTKLVGSRFTILPVSNPIGYYFDAFYQTGFYYNFVGGMQLAAACLLLIPRTTTLGALIYFPIIFNICILTHSLNFTGTRVITSLMLLANLYLLCWDYDRVKFVLFFRKPKVSTI